MEERKLIERAELLKALAHPVRLQIADELCNGPKCVTEIEQLVPASQVNISQHLTVMRHAGIVGFVQNGALRCYYLARPELVCNLVKVLCDEHAVVHRTRDDIMQERMASGHCPHEKEGAGPAKTKDAAAKKRKSTARK